MQAKISFIVSRYMIVQHQLGALEQKEIEAAQHSS